MKTTKAKLLSNDLGNISWYFLFPKVSALNKVFHDINVMSPTTNASLTTQTIVSGHIYNDN